MQVQKVKVYSVLNRHGSSKKTGKRLQLLSSTDRS